MADEGVSNTKQSSRQQFLKEYKQEYQKEHQTGHQAAEHQTGHHTAERQKEYQAGHQNKSSPPRIGVGYQVGSLTVTSPTGQRKGGYTIWCCHCACGGEILLDTRCLQRGTVTHCGCISKVRPGQRDITGMRFGKLVAIEPTGTAAGGSAIWRCLCDCGGQVCAPLHQLVAGYRKSCGCLGHPARKDYVGVRFGRLTVMAYAGKQDGMHRWKCICDCGKETIVGQSLLQCGKTKSCGCLQAESYKENLKLIDGTSVTMLEAGKKRRIASNTSGYTGVYHSSRCDKWIAQINFKGKAYYLGSYADIQDAVRARRQGEEMHDMFLEWYYENHSSASARKAAGQTAVQATGHITGREGVGPAGQGFPHGPTRRDGGV